MLYYGGEEMRWLENLSNAIDYIESHLDKEISYDEVAKIACCSTYYFQRIFSYVAEISLSEYIKRRRMTQAGFDLQRTSMKVLDVALKYGYASPTSFNRAFQSVHQMAPVNAKELGRTLNAYPAIRFSIEVTGGNAMSYNIEKKEAMRIVGIRTNLSENMEKNLNQVPKFWDNILQTQKLQTIAMLGNHEPAGILGISVYKNPRNIFYYIASATDHPALPGMDEFQIPASTWVIFENDGYVKENVQNLFKRFYREWLPFSGYEYAGLPDIEVYPIYNGKLTKGHSEVWIAVKEKKE